MTDWKCELVADASGYRLPSEAQWEYACRAVSRAQFAFGDDERLLPEYGYNDVNSKKRTWPAGEKLPNGWGLFDMHGSVWEWCKDTYLDDYANSPAVDPPGASQGSYQVLRGGSWGDGSPKLPGGRTATGTSRATLATPGLPPREVSFLARSCSVERARSRGSGA